MSKGELIARVQKLLGRGMKDNIQMVEARSLVKNLTYKLTSNAVNRKQAEEICAGRFCLIFETSTLNNVSTPSRTKPPKNSEKTAKFSPENKKKTSPKKPQVEHQDQKKTAIKSRSPSQKSAKNSPRTQPKLMKQIKNLALEKSKMKLNAFNTTKDKASAGMPAATSEQNKKLVASKFDGLTRKPSLRYDSSHFFLA